MTMKKFVWIPMLAFLLIFAAVSAQAEEKAAVVNGEVITQAQVDKAVERMKQQMSMMGREPSPEQIAQMKSNILERLVDQELLKQESKEKGIEVKDAEVEEAIEALKKRFPDEEKFDQALAKAGMTQEELKESKREELKVKKLIDQEVMGKIEIGEEEKKAFFEKNKARYKEPEQVKASHILVRVDKDADEKQKAEARKKIEEVQKKLEEGGDFGKLAKEYSDCPSKEKGGDLGFFRKGQMVPAFEEKAFSMEPGSVSDVVETRFGYHLIKVEDKKAARDVPYEEVKGNIEKRLESQQANEKLKKYIEQLEAEADVEKLVEYSAPSQEGSQAKGAESQEKAKGESQKE